MSPPPIPRTTLASIEASVDHPEGSCAALPAESAPNDCTAGKLASGGQAYRAFGGWMAAWAARPDASHLPLSLIDQAVVSGTSFLTSILIGRICGAADLGVYSLAFTLVVLVTNLQTAVLTTPYTIAANRLAGRARREYAGSVLIHCLMLTAVAIIALGAAGLGWSLLQPAGQGGAVVRGLLVALPLLLLREFVRRFAFAHLRITAVLALDFVVAVIQIGGLAALVFNERLSVANVYLLMALACAIAGGGALFLMRADFRVRLDRVIPELRRSWFLGKWIVASRLTAMAQVYGVHWILAFVVGTAATGVYAASMTVLLAANPFVIGIGNVLEPRAARAMAQDGVQGLNQVVRRTTLLLGSVMGLYCGLIILAGGWIVAWLYQGSQYENQGPTVAVLALAVMVHSCEIGAAHGLRVLERPDLSFRAGSLSLLITLVMGLLLVHQWGTLGAACAVLAGDSAGATLRWLAFSRLTRDWEGRGLLSADTSTVTRATCVPRPRRTLSSGSSGKETAG